MTGIILGRGLRGPAAEAAATTTGSLADRARLPRRLPRGWAQKRAAAACSPRRRASCTCCLGSRSGGGRPHRSPHPAPASPPQPAKAGFPPFQPPVSTGGRSGGRVGVGSDERIRPDRNPSLRAAEAAAMTTESLANCARLRRQLPWGWAHGRAAAACSPRRRTWCPCCLGFQSGGAEGRTHGRRIACGGASPRSSARGRR